MDERPESPHPRAAQSVGEALQHQVAEWVSSGRAEGIPDSDLAARIMERVGRTNASHRAAVARERLRLAELFLEAEHGIVVTAVAHAV
jgi:hypothetical protein